MRTAAIVKGAPVCAVLARTIATAGEQPSATALSPPAKGERRRRERARAVRGRRSLARSLAHETPLALSRALFYRRGGVCLRGRRSARAPRCRRVRLHRRSPAARRADRSFSRAEFQGRCEILFLFHVARYQRRRRRARDGEGQSALERQHRSPPAARPPRADPWSPPPSRHLEDSVSLHPTAPSRSRALHGPPTTRRAAKRRVRYLEFSLRKCECAAATVCCMKNVHSGTRDHCRSIHV